MKIAKSLEYAAAPDAVFAVLSDPAFQEAKCVATHAIRHSAGVRSQGDRTIITTERVLPSDGLPDFAKKLVGETLTVKETQDWGPAGADGSRQGTVTMTVSGAPLALSGTLSLAPRGAGSLELLDSELKASVPLIAGKIEKAAAPPIEAAIGIEHETAQEWLSR
jgi:hypothetical protein